MTDEKIDETEVSGERPNNGDGGEITVEQLRRLLARRTQERDEAQQRADNATRDATGARSTAATQAEGRYNAEVSSVDGALAARTSEADALQEQMERHLEAGEFKQAAAAQRKLAESAAQLPGLRQQKKWLEENKERLIADAAPKQTQPQRAQIDWSRYSRRQQEWIREHPLYLSDEEFQDKVQRAHYAALAEGITDLDSDEYFQTINERIGNGRATTRAQAGTEQPGESETEPPRRKTGGSFEAPVTRRGSSGAARPGEAVAHMTAEEKETAFWMYDGKVNPSTKQPYTENERYQKYAADRDRFKKEGRYGGQVQ